MNDTLAALTARTKARQAAGKIPSYKQHERLAVLPQLPAARRWKLDCVDLGVRLPGQPCGSTLRQCLRFGDITAPLRACSGAQRSCSSCPAYVSRGDAVTDKTSEPSTTTEKDNP